MRSFPEQFAAVVARFPNRPAVTVRRDSRVERFSYGELDTMAARAAAFLRSRGLTAGDRCAILAENDARWCAAYLGILRIGAIAVPFDTAYTAAQAAALLIDSGTHTVLASARLATVAAEAAEIAGCAVALLVEAVSAETRAPDSQECPAQSGDAAVILYTSGTTADPKGVVLTHANLLAERDAAFQIVNVDERDAVLGVLPLFHALAQMANLLLPFSLGAHVVFLETLGTRELLRALDEDGISVFCCVPQFFYLIHQRILAEVDKRRLLERRVFHLLLRVNACLRTFGINTGPLLFQRVHRSLGSRMRLLITGGSRFDPGIGRDLYHLGFTILQAYGLTETSGAATITQPGEPIETVGRPLPGVEIRIVSPDPESSTSTTPGARIPHPESRVPSPESRLPNPDVDGEVLIRGPIVMAGYWNRPDATAAVLKDGWLHTGDLGRLDNHGRLTITGRRKEIIVLASGKNIYPEEIEASYRRSVFIKELCVIGMTQPGAPTAERLHAIVVPDLEVLRQRRIVNISELIRFELENISVSLPPYKRVLGFDVTMEALPRTTTGKLKRHEIVRRHSESVEAAAGNVVKSAVSRPAMPVDPHLQQVIEVVERFVRPGARVRPDSNLELDLGLDSMERVEVIALLEQRFGSRLSEEAAQAAFLVRDLAEAFRSARGVGGVGGVPWETLLTEAPATLQIQGLLKPRRILTSVLFAATFLLVRLLTRPLTIGREKLPRKGPFIISPNHESYLDPFILAGALPFAVFQQLFFVGAADFFRTPFMRWLASQVNVVPADPDAHLLPAMQAAAFGLRHGKVLVLFPEGERSIDGRVKKFKKGAAILSRHLGVSIVPVAIHGVFDIWPRHRPLAWWRLLPWSGHRVTVSIGRPLPPMPAGSYEEQTTRLREVVERLWLDCLP